MQLTKKMKNNHIFKFKKWIYFVKSFNIKSLNDSLVFGFDFAAFINSFNVQSSGGITYPRRNIVYQDTRRV